MGAVLYALAVLADSPKGFWKLDEASGTFVDSSGNGNNSTAVAGTVTYGQTPIMPSGKSIRLDGTFGTYVDLPTSVADWSQIVTLEYWLKKNSNTNTYGSIIGKDQTSSQIAAIHTSTVSSVINLTVKSGAGTQTSSNNSTSLVASTGYHVVMTMPAGTSPTVSWYLNGVADGAAVMSSAPRNNNGSFRLGSSPDSFWGCLDGWLQGVAVYDTVLSSARALAHYNAGIGADTFSQVLG